MIGRSSTSYPSYILRWKKKQKKKSTWKLIIYSYEGKTKSKLGIRSGNSCRGVGSLRVGVSNWSTLTRPIYVSCQKILTLARLVVFACRPDPTRTTCWSTWPVSYIWFIWHFLLIQPVWPIWLIHDIKIYKVSNKQN